MYRSLSWRASEELLRLCKQTLRISTFGAGFGLLVACSEPLEGAPSSSGGPVDPVEAGGPACGRLTTACPAGRACEGADDCIDRLCREAKCQTPAPADGTKNGDETDVDCGGTRSPACGDGKICGVKADCSSGVCTGGVCQVPTATDGVKNGDETGVDCGGAKAPKCKTGDGCLADRDCDAVLCDLAKKKCAAPSYTDGLKNGDETGIDCGGPKAPNRCATGQSCKANADCNNVLCDIGKTDLCKAPAYDDGLKNGDESGIDCGGPKAPNRCGVGQGCAATADCNQVACDVGATKACLPPSSTDTIKNGTETDVDCGGSAPTNATACAAGKTCALDADCKSDGCDYKKQCAIARSCSQQNGGDTCGAGEIGQPGTKHESCCTSLPLPDGTLLDKYEITAGRMREFIRRTSGNVGGWVNTHRTETAQISSMMVDYLPTGDDTPSRTYTRCNEAGLACGTETRGFGVNDHLGNTVFFPDRPCANCGQGCYLGTQASGGYGHPTYWWDAATQASRWGAQPRKFSQAELDVKSLNCVTQVLLSAFCAWDGGRLATSAETGGTAGAWGANAYPWGAQTFRDSVAGATGRIAYPSSPTEFLVPMMNTDGTSNYANAIRGNYTNWNPFSTSVPYYRYVWPLLAAANFAQTDQAFTIAAPGRMVNDFRQTGVGPDDGFHDIAGNLMEAGGDYTGILDDANHMAFPRANWTGGSWEGHAVGRSGFNMNVMTKYGKMGGRCIR
jgi:hypothetical protein